MHKPRKSLRVWEITTWHLAGFSLHAGPHVHPCQCEHFLFIHVWTFGAGPQCGTCSAGPHTRLRKCECTFKSSPIICRLASRAWASQMTMYGFSWGGSHSPWHRCVRCIMTSLATTIMSNENAPNIEFSYISFGVWNDGNSWNQTLTIGRLFQLCISNYSQQEKLKHSEYIFVTFTKFLLWVNLWYFCTWIRVAAHVKFGRQTMQIQIRSHCYSSNLSDYIKTHDLISTKLW